MARSRPRPGVTGYGGILLVGRPSMSLPSDEREKGAATIRRRHIHSRNRGSRDQGCGRLRGLILQEPRFGHGLFSAPDRNHPRFQCLWKLPLEIDNQ